MCVFVLVLVVVLVMYHHQPAETVVREESVWEDGLGHLNDAIDKCTKVTFRYMATSPVVFLLECVSHREFSILPPGSSMGRDTAEGVAIQGRGL